MGAENNEPVSTSRNLFGSTPDFRTSDTASAMLSITVEIRKFPVSLTTFAAGAFSSTTKVFCPMASKSTWQRWICAAGASDNNEELRGLSRLGTAKHRSSDIVLLPFVVGCLES